MGHSIGDGLIVLALAAAFVAYFWFRHRERQSRLEVIHRERLAAMDKGIPLPELPLDATALPKPPDPHAPLLHGLVWLAFGVGGMSTLYLIDPAGPAGVWWSLPLPLVFLGFGLVLYYVLAKPRGN